MSEYCQLIFLQVVEFGKVDPFAIKGYVGIDNSAIASRNKYFFGSIRVEEH
jgi:hypothetical protein